jgi:hypothetical protein
MYLVHRVRKLRYSSLSLVVFFFFRERRRKGRWKRKEKREKKKERERRNSVCGFLSNLPVFFLSLSRLFDSDSLPSSSAFMGFISSHPSLCAKPIYFHAGDATKFSLIPTASGVATENKNVGGLLKMYEKRERGAIRKK